MIWDLFYSQECSDISHRPISLFHPSTFVVQPRRKELPALRNTKDGFSFGTHLAEWRFSRHFTVHIQLSHFLSHPWPYSAWGGGWEGPVLISGDLTTSYTTGMRHWDIRKAKASPSSMRTNGNSNVHSLKSSERWLRFSCDSAQARNLAHLIFTYRYLEHLQFLKIYGYYHHLFSHIITSLSL